MMHPEQTTTGFTLWRQVAECGPRGLLRGLIWTSRPPCLSALLPRVHASDMASAQPVQTPSCPSSAGAAPAHALTASTMPNTGWDRIKDLFQRDASHSYSEEVTNVVKSGIVAAIIGFIYGGLPAARHAKQRYIQMSQAELYTSRVEAVRSAHNAAVRGFVRYGSRWSWRVAAFVTLFNSVSTGLSVYRDKYTLSSFAAAGAVTGGLFRVNLGVRGLVAGSIIGAVLGTARLHLTDELIGNLNTGSGMEESKKDVERIRELLGSRQNEDVGQDSSSQ
ncbi:complex I assembly factor TIMMDC1, mitochondrial isoform X2 [Dunckerocampus dactyliophorus]|uniref:complex I assembly factor TIMMDC1, mitochondrial isoform X2 n=1 Tax=Dunckerocampus dactyliophorus TaxID=161453 RepID=UPI002406651D|nr:complex I assembly factor TIMMDC1, mitochondrial isoform X2 [Dunckerocampus dactyliophorus]